MSDSPSGLLKYPFIFRSPTGCVIITDKAMCYLPKESESLPKTSLRWYSGKSPDGTSYEKRAQERDSEVL